MRRAYADHARTVDTTAAMDAMLARSEMAPVDLLAVILPFGPFFGITRLAWTNAEADIVWDGVTYKALGATRFSRSTLRTVIGVEVDTLTLTLDPYVPAPSPVGPGDPELTLDVIPGTTITIPAAAALGLLDKARVQLRRAILPAPARWHVTPDLSAGTVLLFVGEVGDIELDRTRIKLTVRSLLDQLSMQLPRNFYQPGCLNTLFDAACAKDRGAYAHTRTVASGGTTMTVPLVDIGPTAPAGWWDQGYLEVASPTTFYGLRRTIRSATETEVRLIQPFPFPLTAGWTVTLYPGCDKTLATCAAKFANRDRFRGFPFIPNPDTAY